MIKLERGECPKELSEEVVKSLTEMYKQNKDKDVWNNPIIKKPLKEALLNMSYSKCVYCECKLNIESKDATIDHFKPKVNNEDRVVEWSNLVPSCLRCNRNKSCKEDEIINPFDIDPKKHLAVRKENKYRIKEKTELGKNTRKVLKLNDVDRLMVARMAVCEKIIDKLEELEEDIGVVGLETRYITRFENIMQECSKDTDYSAVKAINILSCESYIRIKKILISKEKWSIRLDGLEDELKSIALDLV